MSHALRWVKRTNIKPCTSDICQLLFTHQGGVFVYNTSIVPLLLFFFPNTNKYCQVAKHTNKQWNKFKFSCLGFDTYWKEYWIDFKCQYRVFKIFPNSFSPILHFLFLNVKSMKIYIKNKKKDNTEEKKSSCCGGKAGTTLMEKCGKRYFTFVKQI